MGGGGYGGAPSVPVSHGGGAGMAYGSAGGSGFDAHDSSASGSSGAPSRPHRSNSPFSSDSEHSDDDDGDFGEMAPGSSLHQASSPNYFDHGPHDPESSSYQDNFRIDDMGNPMHMTGPLLTGIYEIDTASDPRNPALIEHVVGRVYMLSKSQGGSRFVQQRLEDRDPAAFAIFFAEMVRVLVATRTGFCVGACTVVSLSLCPSVLAAIIRFLHFSTNQFVCFFLSPSPPGASRVRADDGQFCALCP
jgi:hypothetical protein